MLHHGRGVRLSVAGNLLVLAAAVLVLAACAGSGAPAQAVALELGNSGLAPASVTVSVGQPVELNVVNRTGVTHELAVADIPIVTSGGSGEHNMAGMSGDMAAMTAMPPIHMMVAGGEQQSLTFTPSKPGEYEFTCLTPNHQERGVLIVTN